MKTTIAIIMMLSVSAFAQESIQDQLDRIERQQQSQDQQRQASYDCESAKNQYILRSIAAGGDVLQIYTNADAIFHCD